MRGKRRIILAFYLSISILALVSAYAVKSIIDYKQASGWLNHTQEVINQSNSLLSSVQETESSQREYVITAQQGDLEYYEVGLKDMAARYRLLKHLIIDNPQQQMLLDSIHHTLDLSIDFNQKVILCRQNKGLAEAQNLLYTGPGKNLMLKAKGIFERFVANENELLSARRVKAEQHFTQVLSIIIGSILIILVIALFLLYTYIKDYNRRILSGKQLQDEKDQVRKLSEFQEIILNESDYAIITTTYPESIITSFNKGAERMLGYNAEELIGLASPAFMHDQHEVIARAKVLTEELRIKVEPGNDVFHVKSRLGNITDENEYTYIRKDGVRITVELSVTTLRNTNNDIIGYLEIAKDITEKKKDEIRLRESELLIKKFLDCLPVGIYIVGHDGKPYYANRKFQEILGQGLIPGLSPEDFSEVYKIYLAGTENIYPASQRPIIRALQGENNICVEDLEILKEGIRIPLRVNATSVFNSAGNIEYAIAVFEDITDIKEAKQQLIQAKKLADESVILKETFLANMSHEIRTPMNAIIGFTDLLLKRKLKGQETDYVQVIRNSAESLMRIINDILDVSKINSGMMTFEEHPISIKEMFASLNMMLIHRAAEKNLDLSFEYGTGLPNTLLGDPMRLNQIIINLVGNAIKFTKKGGVVVFAKVLDEDMDTCNIEFSVTDSGIGIAEDKLQTIFERFTQAESSTTRRYGGTGLGLNIAKLLVELQGGKMMVKSIAGIGSVFSFTLIFKKTEKVSPAKHHQVSGMNMQELCKSKILIVEDNTINIKFVLSLLAEYKINADIAENGKQAIEKIKENLYDVVIMDIEMPEMNGYEATAIIRNDLKNDIPIIAMTANAMVGEKEKCIQLGMNDYISKPISAGVLFEKMILALKTGREKDENLKNKIINLDFLAESMGGNEEVILEIIDMFIKQVPVDLSVIQEAISQSDYVTIRQSSHRMKSTISVMGISSVTVILEEMETLAVSACELEKITLLAGQLKEILDSAIKEAEREKMNLTDLKYPNRIIIPQPINLQ